MFYFGNKPHITKDAYYIEAINEISLSISMHHLVLFSNFNLNYELKYNTGFTLVGNVGTMAFVNLAWMIYESVRLFFNNKRLKMQRKAYLKHTKNGKINMTVSHFKSMTQFRKIKRSYVQKRPNLQLEASTNCSISAGFAPKYNPIHRFFFFKKGET